MARTAASLRLVSAAHARSSPTGPAAHDRSVTPRPESGRKLLLVLLFWFGAATAAEVWWLRTPLDSLGSTGDVLTAAGRLTGLAAGYSLLVQILLMSRAGWLERSAGVHALTRWHRRLGATLVFCVLAHLSLTVAGYAAIRGVSVLPQAWEMYQGYEDIDDAFLAAGLLTALGVLAIRKIRRAMPYEAWYWLHLSAYLVLWLGFSHQFTHGQDLADGFGRWYWIALHVGVAATVLWSRIVRPVVLNARHRLRVAEVVPETADTFSIYVQGRDLHRLQAQAGQHLRWRFLARGCWWQVHPFSLSAAPNGEWLRLTVKATGRYTQRLQQLRPGVRVRIHAPSGMFTAAQRHRPAALLIAAGSGIAPIRALIDDLPTGTILIYRARDGRSLVFRDELDWLAHQQALQIRYVLGSRHDPQPRYVFSPRGMRELVPDITRRDVYLCGPPELIAHTIKVLRRLGVPRRQIHLDPFEF